MQKSTMIGLLAMVGLLATMATPAFANPITFFFVNSGGSTTGGLNASDGSLGSIMTTTMSTNTFTFSGPAPRVINKIASGTDNFILYLTGVGSGNKVCVDLTVAATGVGTDSGTTCVSPTGGNGAYTFSIPSTNAGAIASGATVTVTVKCDASSSISCSGINLSWAGAAGFPTNSNVQIPEAAFSTPEFPALAILPAALALAALMLVRKVHISVN